MSSAAVIQVKKQTLDTAANAVAGTPPQSCKADCQPCHRVDLLLLVVTPSIVPKDHAKVLETEGYAWAPSFDAEFGTLTREATVPVARLASPGYIYVYYPARQRWDVWQVMRHSLTRKVMHQVSAEQYAEKQAGLVLADPKAVKPCSQGAANLPAQLISISGAGSVDEVWMAYSPHLWAPKVLQRYQDDPEVAITDANGKAVKKKLREARGRKLMPSAIVGGSFPESGCLPLNATALEHNVADFGAAVPAGGPSWPLAKAFELARQPLEPVRFGRAAAMEKTVRGIEKASNPLYVDKSLIVMLDDSLGVAEEHNHLRLAEQEAKRLWSIGGDGVQQPPDPERAWKLRSSLHEDMIEQWEAARDAKRITDETSRAMHKNLRPVTEEDFERDQAAGKYPKGTTWEPLYLLEGGLSGKPRLGPDGKLMEQTVQSRYRRGGTTRLGRLRLPPGSVQQAADKRGAGDAVGFRDRLRGRVDWPALKSFRDDFKAESDLWDKRIAQFDRDFLAWRQHWKIKTFLLYDFDRDIKLVKPDLARGTLDQQVADVAARVSAVDKAFGGGAIGPESAKDLAKLYKLNPNLPENWIDNALLDPFDVKRDVLDDPGNRSETSEGAVSFRALGQQVRDALARNRERARLEEAVQSLLAARAQFANLIASAVDKKSAEALGLTALSAQQASKSVRLHLQVELLAEELIDVDSNRLSRQKFVFNMRVPAGVALDEVREAMQQGVMPLELEPKRQTTRQQRRFTERQFRRLAGRVEGEVNYPVLLDRGMIERLQREAIRDGESLVEIVPDGHKGLSSGPIKVPQKVANRLIREQAVSAKKAMSGEGKVIGVIATAQVLALIDTTIKIFTDKGIDQADAVVSTLSSMMTLFESANLFRLHVWTLRTNGARTLTAQAALRMSRLRLGAGLFGAAGSAFDMALAIIRSRDAARSGDSKTAGAYYTAAVLYGVSGASCAVGAFATYQSYMAAGISVRAVGVGGAALLGAWATGVGIVLSVAAFGYMLYALNTAYEAPDVFLDRSYWGKGERVEGKFGQVTRQQLQDIRNNKQLDSEARAQALRHIVQTGMTAEENAFAGLLVGMKTGLVWHKNWFSADEVQFKLEANEYLPNRKVDVQLQLLAAEGAPGETVLSETGLVTSAEKNDEQFYELEVSFVLKSDAHKKSAFAKATYNVYDEFERVSLTRDTLIARRDA